MNLINKKRENCDILNYRQYQYDLISEIFNVCFDYINRFDILKYSNLKYTIIEQLNYNSINHYKLNKHVINLDNNPNYNFLELDIPILIDKMFFKLNGCYYIPMIYIIDSPIYFRKNNTTIYSLFNNLTIYKKKNKVMFNNKFINLEKLTDLYTKDIRDISLYKAFNVKTNLDIKKEIDNIFFDNWTSELYRSFYNQPNFTFENIIEKVMSNDKSVEFNDLTFKRLSFIELLMQPLFTSIRNYIYLKHNYNQIIQLPLKRNAIIQYFFSSGNNTSMKSNSFASKSGLNGKNLYTNSNGFSGLLALKASFKTPFNSNDLKTILPKSISKIHETHKFKICPITISNKDPGSIVSLIQNQKIELKFGKFL